MTFKIFWWTEFILNLSTQSKKLPAVQWQAALPPRLSCPIMLHGSRASQPLSKALKMSRGNIFSQDLQRAQLDRARRNGTPLPMCGAGFFFTQTQKPWRDWLDAGVAHCPRGHPGHSSPDRSPEHTVHTSHPAFMFHCCFLGYQFFCQRSFTWPPFSQKASNSTRWKQRNSDALWKYPTLQPTCSDASQMLGASKEYLYLKFANIAWISCKRIKLFLHDVAPFSVSHWDVTYYIHLF